VKYKVFRDQSPKGLENILNKWLDQFDEIEILYEALTASVWGIEFVMRYAGEKLKEGQVNE